MKHFADHASLRRWALSSLVLIFGWCALAQDIAMGTWRTHFSYNNAKHLAVTTDKVFCATTNGLFSREIASGSIRKLSKIDGLSDVGVSALAYNENQNVLVIGYASGYVDFVYENDLLSISDIATSNLEGDKSINDVTFNATKTFLATDLGVIVVNTSNAKISENYVQIGTGGIAVEVLEIITKNDSLFVRTTEGIQVGKTSVNLLDFTNWTRFPSTSAFRNLTLVGEKIYASTGSDLMIFSSGSWQDTGFGLPTNATRLFEVNGNLMTAADGMAYQLEEAGFVSVFQVGALSVNDIGLANGEFYLADSDKGLLNASGSVLSPFGPRSDTFSNFRIVSDNLYAFHAPSPFTYDGSVQEEWFSIFAEGQWQTLTIENFTNVSDVASFNGNFYYSSIGDGLYDEINETILTDIPGSSAELDTVITALASGEQLWVSSFANQNPIHLMDQDQSWISYTSLFTSEDEYLTIDLSETGIGWMGASSGSITVFDPVETNSSALNTIGSFIDIDISIEDNAWVATNRGPQLFPDASFIFSDSQGVKPTFENRTLFENEQINAVMTDGGNRIWFGTNQGLWVYNENTTEQVAVFNERNSPLPSNRIIQLAYNRSNGEVFVYTDKGMVSYRSSSSVGSRTHRNVNIFPNPVRPEYQGLVGLSGLARNVNIKVTDVSGNLVKEIDANGGSASWDLTNVRGGKVTTGVYLFFSSTSDGEETYVGKIAVVR